MKLHEVRALEQHVKTLEAAKRLETQDVKGLGIQVVFHGGQGGGPGGQEEVRIFLPADDPAFNTVMQTVMNRVGAAKADAESKVSELSAKISNGVS